MAHVVRAYQPTARLPESEAELGAMYRSLLHGQRALLLMDNVASAGQVAPLIPPKGCMLLVTSRQHFALPGLYALDLDALPPADARALLRKIAPCIREYAGEIAALCACLPLPLCLAGSALAERTDLEPADYMRRLRDARAKLALVEASLSLSYDLLDVELQRLWRMLAAFPGTFDQAAAAAVWEMGADPAQDALSELLRYSLVEWNSQTRRYCPRDLARLFADDRLAEGERFVGQGRHAVYYKEVAAAADQWYLQGGEEVELGLALFDLEWANIQAGQAWAAAHVEEEAAARLCSDYVDAGVYCLSLRQHPQEQIRWLEAALTIARQIGDRRGEGAHLSNLGWLNADLWGGGSERTTVRDTRGINGVSSQ